MVCPKESEHFLSLLRSRISLSATPLDTSNLLAELTRRQQVEANERNYSANSQQTSSKMKQHSKRTEPTGGKSAAGRRKSQIRTRAAATRHKRAVALSAALVSCILVATAAICMGQQQQQSQLQQQVPMSVQIHQQHDTLTRNQRDKLHSLADSADGAAANSLNSVHPHGQHQHQQQQQHSKKLASNWQNQNLNKLKKYLNERQHELIKQNPGSLLAVARALKMAIVECQYQMRHEPWNCPIYGFSIRPAEVFGMLMARSFKETSFIQSLLSSAVAHSVARACTESTISTCGRKQLSHGNGFSEDIEFGRHFAQQFMESTYELPASSSSGSSSSQLVVVGGVARQGPEFRSAAQLAATGNELAQQQQQQHQRAGPKDSSEPMWRERKLRHDVNAHNDEVGRLLKKDGAYLRPGAFSSSPYDDLLIPIDNLVFVLRPITIDKKLQLQKMILAKLNFVLDGMRRECKCHGLSGACTLSTCWLKLPPFREVAKRLHDSLEGALLVKMHGPHQSNNFLTSRKHKSLTSAMKKSNKKRSSPTQPANHLNGLGRSSTSLSESKLSSSSSAQIGDTKSSNVGGTRLQAFDDTATPPSTITTLAITANSGGTINGEKEGAGAGETNAGMDTGIDNAQSSREYNSLSPNSNTNLNSIFSDSHMSRQMLGSNDLLKTMTPVKKRPIARSIGITDAPIAPSKFDLIYAEKSPDFCVPSEIYNIKGTQGRLCSTSPNVSNSCDKLCCGRGYRTEIREEKYKCECKFQFCCKLQCKTCSRQQTLHKCL